MTRVIGLKVISNKILIAGRIIV